ncbi:MAG TPA: sialidase family protein [Longimicrobiales bacterium]
MKAGEIETAAGIPEAGVIEGGAAVVAAGAVRRARTGGRARLRGRACSAAAVPIPLVVTLALLAGCGGSAPALGPTLTLVDGGASNPTAAVDPRTGVVYVAWVTAQEGRADVYLARIEGGEASAPVRVNDIPGDAAPHEQAPAQVAVAPNGDVLVLWQNNTPVAGRRFPASDLRLARSTDGGRTFEPAVTVNDDAGGLPSSHTFHDIAVAPDGTVYVSWIDSRERDRARAALGIVEDATMGHGGNGGAAAAAGEADLPSSDVRVARSTDGGRTFEPGVVVARDVCPCCRTSLAVAPDGAVLVAWRRVFDGDVRDIVVARSTDGGRTFSAPVRVHDDGWVIPGCPHAGASLAVDAAGRVHVAWYTGRQERQGIYHAVSTDGGLTFGDPRPLLAGGWVPVSLVRLAAAPEGGVWGAWDDRRAEQRRVTIARAGESGVKVLDDDVPGSAPAVAAAAGTAVVAWLDDGAVRARVALSAPR